MMTTTETLPDAEPTSATAAPATWLAVTIAFAVADLALHLATAGRYGYFRDELYYLACGRHLDWGYVDHAPLVALAARASVATFGDSMLGIRILPALAGALKIVLTGLVVRELGGRVYAVALACLCMLAAPAYLAEDSFLSMNAFEPLFWMGCAYCLLLAVNRREERYLALFGVVAGLGLMNKHSMVFFGAALVVGLAATPERRLVASRWFWIGGLLAALIFAPNLLWEYRHGWATLEDLRNVQTTGKNVELSPLAFVAQQFLLMLPLSAPVWLAGLYHLLVDRDGKRYRFLGVAYLVALVLMIALHGKNYYLVPAYPMLFAAGGVAVERLATRAAQFRWLRVALPALVAAGGAALAPYAAPILPVETFLAYQDALGFKLPKSEVGHTGPLPQHFGDRFGWPEMVEQVAAIYNGLPPEERTKTAIYANNYGEAGAIDLFGPRYGLPPAISPHQTYFLWGPRQYTGEEMIVLQDSREGLEPYFASVEAVGEVGHPYAMGEEHYTIFLCRGLNTPLPELWPRLKHWN